MTRLPKLIGVAATAAIVAAVVGVGTTGGLGAAAVASSAGPAPKARPDAGDAGDPAVVDTLEAQLSGIDFLPDRARLDDVAPGNAANELLAIAADDDELAGRRVRALRTLSAYSTPRVRAALLDAVNRYRVAERGVQLVYLRAAVESLADLGGVDAAVALESLLEHPTPDIRAAAALGLGAVGVPSAAAALSRRLGFEKVPFVRLALERALALLT